MGAPNTSAVIESVRKYEGSHRVDVVGSRAIIRDVDLFCAFNPQFDASDDDRIAHFTNEVTRRIYHETVARMKTGQFPRVVLRHDKPGRSVDPTAIGRIASLREETRDGVAYLVGDIEMPIEHFESYVLSDDYPRRSAEFDPTALRFLANVALLGREAPARPLADTRFAFESHSDGIERPLQPLTFRNADRAVHDSGVAGGANTFIPAPTKARTMDDTTTEDPMKAIQASIESLSKSVHECIERIGKLESTGSDERKDEDERVEHEAVPARRRGKSAVPPGFVPKSQFESERDTRLALEERVNTMEASIRRAHAEKMVNDAINAGFELQPQAKQIIEKLAGHDEATQRSEFELIRSVARKAPIGSMTSLHEAVQRGNVGYGLPAAPARPLTDMEAYRVNEQAQRIFHEAESLKQPKSFEACYAEALAAIGG